MEASTCYNMTLDTYTFQFFVSAITSKMELFGTIFNSFHFLIIGTKNSIVDVVGVLDPTLITDIFVLHSSILINLKPGLASYIYIGQSVRMAKKMAGCYEMGLH